MRHHLRAFTQRHRSFDAVFQLADVARPAVRKQELRRLRMDSGYALAAPLSGLVKKMLG